MKKTFLHFSLNCVVLRRLPNWPQIEVLAVMYHCSMTIVKTATVKMAIVEMAIEESVRVLLAHATDPRGLRHTTRSSVLPPFEGRSQ